MDSFYDAPRRAPEPRINKILSAPVVPEVSIIATGKPTRCECPNSNDYSKLFSPVPSEKKQVRFDGTTFNQNQQTRNLVSSQDILFQESNVPPLKDPPKFPMDRRASVFDIVKHKELFKSGLNGNKKENTPLSGFPCNLGGKTFEEIYMANVPNRQLDLSILEEPVHRKSTNRQNKNDLPLTKIDYNSKEFFCNKSNYNYTEAVNTEINAASKQNKGNKQLTRIEENVPIKETEEEMRAPRSYHSFRLQNPPHDSRKSNIDYEEFKVQEKQNLQMANKNDDEPTIKDLFKIIHQQNEQILLLQKQVADLTNCVRYPQVQETQPKMENQDNFSRNPKGPLSKFAIDVKATSFELSFRPQCNKFIKKNDFCEPKIQEVLEVDDSKTIECSKEEDLPLTLPNSFYVRQPCPSPEPSIQIDMDDYNSSGEDDATEDIGLTFYRGLMNQVNNALKNVQTSGGAPKKTNETMYEVKKATLKHLKSIGVNLPPIDAVQTDHSGNTDLTPSDVSFEVKQLLMKYLPDDQLAKLRHKQEAPPQVKPCSSDFSFASLQYMKKYNLIPSDKRSKKGEVLKNVPQKVLDISTLKLQPKFF